MDLRTMLKTTMQWCVFAVVFCAPFSKSISEVAMVAAISALFAGKAIDRSADFKCGGLQIPLIIFVLTVIPSFFNTPYMGLSVKALFTKVLKYVFFYIAVVESFDTKGSLKRFLTVAACSIALILADGFIQYYITHSDILHSYPAFKYRPVGSSEGFFRGFPTASFPFPNDLAAWILLMIFPAACVVVFDMRGNRFRYVIAMLSAGLFYLLWLTKTRAAWMGFAISTVYLALSKKMLWMIVLLIVAIAMPFILKMEMAQYILGVKSVSDRMDMWRIGARIFNDHPVVGNGLNTFFRKYMEYRADEWKGLKGSYAHNCYLQMAADVGVLGLAGFLFFIGAYFRSVCRGLKNVRDPLYYNSLLGVLLGIFAFLVLAFFDTNLYSLNLISLFWCQVGISISAISVFSKEPV